MRFGYLQVMDVLTTLAFLLSGVQEGNPLVKSFIAFSGSAVAGLIYVKLIGLSLGIFCWLRNRKRLLDRVNMFYAVLVCWNMLCLIVGLSQLGR